DGGTPTQHFAGYIDEVRIWNIALTQTEIQTNMASEIPTNSVGLVAYYQMTDGSGITLTDNSGNGNNGALIGGVNFTSPATPLPVELTSFTATTKSSSVELKWKTATELSCYGYEVEKIVGNSQSATDGQSPNKWVKIGFVQGSGNSNSPQKYSFADESPVIGKSYYRLKMIDMDGSFEYSKEVEVNTKLPSQFALQQNYPNPFNPTTMIEYSIPETGHTPSLQTTLKVYDVLGKEVTTLVNEMKGAGNYVVKFNASKLSSGNYLYKLQLGNFVQTRKMILTK
ncbi:MAG: T9SS type A sorting domain-containing protein, partial [Ignavibacteria bacterium]|nr:T9SS type A sorting domain-containing protein [Ignavibacteria bacterium]